MLRPVRDARVIPVLMSIAMMVVGLVNFLTGMIALLGFQHAQLVTEYSQYLEVVSSSAVSDVLAVFIGLVVIGLGMGLYHRYRVAWRWALFFQCIAIANSLYGAFVLQTFLCSVVFLVVLIIFRSAFSRRSAQHMTYAQIIAWISVLFALAYGVVGSYLLRAQFSHLHTWVDAVYYTIVTYSTVGYGDIVPVTANAKIFTISMIVVGISSFVATISVLLGPLIEGRVKGVLNIMKHIKKFKDHVIICGNGPMASYAAKLIAESDGLCYFIVGSSEQATILQAKGYHAVVSSGNERDDLEAASIHKAKAVICAYDEDADNILTVMTAAQLCKAGDHTACDIVCRIDQLQNVEKAKMVGATQVASPAIIGGEMMAKYVLQSGQK